MYVTLWSNTQKQTSKLETWDMSRFNPSCLKEMACPEHMTNDQRFTLKEQTPNKYNTGPTKRQVEPLFRRDWSKLSNAKNTTWNANNGTKLFKCVYIQLSPS